MGTNERPHGSLLCLFLAVFGAADIGVWLWISSADATQVWPFWILVALGVLAVGGAAYCWWRACRPNWEDVRGIAAIVLVFSVVVAVGWSVHRPFTDWLWLQLVVLSAAALLALVLVATEWSRVGLGVTAVVMGVLIVALVVRVGHRAEQAAVITEPIAKAETELTSLQHSAQKAADDANAKSEATFTAALDTLVNAFPVAPEPFRRLGAQVHEALSDQPPRVDEARAAVYLLLGTPVPPQESVQSLAVRDAATEALAAVPSGAKAAPSSAAAEDALTALKCARDRATCPEGTTPPTLADALHTLKVEMAAYRSAVSPADEELRAAAAAAAAADVEPLETSVWAAAAAGPPAIFQSITQNNSLDLVPGPVGWVILGLLAVWAARGLMRLNAAQMPGPVSIGEVGGTDLKSVLHVALLKNLKTPAAAPGSALTQSITDLSALAGPEAGVLGKFVTVITNAISPSRGFTVDVDVVAVEKSSKGAPASGPAATAADKENGNEEKPTRVLVRVSTTSTKESVGSATFERDSPQKAMQAAGLWAAGFLLRRSTRVPSWASWNEATAEALDTANAEEPSLADLEDAARTAPSSGWILVLYGNQLELAGRRLDAVGVYARAVAAHPRYLIARYRLAVALGMSAHDDAEAWTTAPLAQRASVVRSLGDVAARLGVNPWLVTTLSDKPTQPNLRNLSRDLLRTIVEDTSWWRQWIGSLRRSERSMDWLAWWHGGRSSSASTRWLAKSAIVVYGDRTDLGAVHRRAKQANSSWQISYNLACHLASSESGTGLDELETCLVRPGVDSLKAHWVRTDPDLASISKSPRFQAFCAQLDQGGSE